MARMLGNTPCGPRSTGRCTCCGHNGPEHVTYRRNQRSREDAEVRAYVSALWSEDWDSTEDAVYDSS